MRVCELRFDTPDPRNSDYSLLEVDTYTRIPADEYDFQHRLTLRKNLCTKKFEVLRRFWNGREEIVFEGNFEDALRFINRKKKRRWEACEPEEPCRHRPPESDPFCPLRR